MIRKQGFFGALILTILLQTVFGIVLSFGAGKLPAKSEPPKATEDEIVFEAKPAKEQALFDEKEKIGYTVRVKNNTTDAQSGTVGYTVMTPNDEVLTQNSITINVGKNDDKNFSLSIPAQKPGFYKVNITINTADYDDTIRRVFGVNPKKIKSSTVKPADFDEFWYNTRDSLTNVPIDAKVTLQPGMEKGNTACYLVEMKSFGNILVRGWLTIAKDRKPGQKVPVWLVVPGYGGTGVKPIYGPNEMAVFAFNCRGQGNSKDKINPTKEGYLTTNIENRYKYIYRGAIMDCIRAVDFICSRPELDSKNIIISGGSMGGYLAIATASIDKRIKLCSANNPVFCSYRDLVGSKDWPMSDFMKYTKARHVSLDRILNTLDYYDLKYFSPNLKCPALIGISLLDNLAPPYNEYVMLNEIKGKYKLFVYPNLGHEVPPPLFTYLSNWMIDEFGIF